MLALDQFEIFIPDSFLNILDLESETNLPKEMLSVFRLIYGLHKIPIWRDGLDVLLSQPIDKLLQSNPDLKKIKYIIYLHTANWVSPYGDHLISRLKRKYNLHSAISFGMTMRKCVSYFQMLEIIPTIFSIEKNIFILVLTGEIAFTPKLRVVPRSTVVGDAATASLFSSTGDNHQLLSVINRFVPGYSKGIYLSNLELQEFDRLFILSLSTVIEEAVIAAKLLLSNISIILPHNVNIPTWKKISESLHLPMSKIYFNNITRFGHCFCSDHIINLKFALQEQRIKKGDYYVMAGCGLGFYLSAAVFRY